LDFCYYGNSFLIIYLWAFNDDPLIFIIVFSIANGPLLWAIALFRNSLVFHALDKLTSLFIHISPALTTFCIRWYRDSDVMQRWQVCETYGDQCPINFLWTFVYPMAFFTCHQIYYYIVVQVVLGPKVKSNKDLLTSYRYLTGQKGFIFKLVNCFGKKHRVLMFGVINWIAACFMIALTYVWYNWFWAHFAFLILMTVIATWNGAGFYINVFANTYTKDVAATKVKTVV